MRPPGDSVLRRRRRSADPRSRGRESRGGPLLGAGEVELDLGADQLLPACPPDWRQRGVALSPVSRDCTGLLPGSESPGRALLTHPKRTCRQSLQGTRCRLENSMTFQRQPRKQGATSQPVTEVPTKASKNLHFLKRSQNPQTPQCSNHDVQYTVNSYSSEENEQSLRDQLRHYSML